MDSSNQKGMSCKPRPTTLILNEEEQTLINNTLENMNNQLTQITSDLKPRTIAIDISRLQNAMLSLLQQVIVLQREILSASKRAYQNEMGEIDGEYPIEAPTFLEADPIEIGILYDPNEYISAYDAADMLKITLKTLYKRLKDKTLPGTKILGKWYIRKNTINNLLNGETREPERKKTDE